MYPLVGATLLGTLEVGQSSSQVRKWSEPIQMEPRRMLTLIIKEYLCFRKFSVRKSLLRLLLLQWRRGDKSSLKFYKFMISKSHFLTISQSHDSTFSQYCEDMSISGTECYLAYSSPQRRLLIIASATAQSDRCRLLNLKLLKQSFCIFYSVLMHLTSLHQIEGDLTRHC